MGALLQDVKYGLRIHAKTLSLTTMALLTLALGIGACTAVFSVVEAILLRPLPYSQSDRVVIPWRLVPTGVQLGFDKIPWSAGHFRLLSQESKAFQDLGAFKSQPFTLTGIDEPKLLAGLRASAGFFSTLGVSPVIGRTFTPEEDQPGHDHVVILGYELWRDQFGASQHMLGLPLELNGEVYTVIGVMPPDFAFPRANEMPGSFEFPREARLWAPLAIPAENSPWDANELVVIGRLKPGVSIEHAQSEMDVFAQREDRENPRNKGWYNSRVVPLQTQVVGDTRLPLLLMLAAVGVVLLIACSNVASLLLTRSLVRRREFTLRAALGAGQHRLVRQVLTESLVLAAAAGGAGVLLAEAGIHLVKIFGPADIPRLQETSLDVRVFIFAFLVTIITGILFGMAPAVGATRKNLGESLKDSGQRSGGGSLGPRVRRVLIVSQVALALVLVIASGLVTKTFFRLLRVTTGYNAGNVLTFGVSLLNSRYSDDDRVVLLYDKLLHQLQSVPGVGSVAITNVVPMAGSPDNVAIRLLDRPQTAGAANANPVVSYTIASPRYLSALGTPLLRGRDFLESDNGDSMPVTIINNVMARKFWPDKNPIGQQIKLSDPKYPAMTIIGIAADVKHVSLRENSGPEMYVPYTQKPWPPMLQMQVVVRSLADPAAIIGNVREAIHSVDSDLPMDKVATLSALEGSSIAQPRFSMLLLGAFGILALVLASVGMYGVISYSVTQRTQEIGVRMAMGAQQRDIFAMVLGQGVRLAGVGVVIGLLFALALTQIMRRFLYRLLYSVDPTDPFVYGAAVSLLLLSVALLACYMPASRATRVDPIVALRDE